MHASRLMTETVLIVPLFHIFAILQSCILGNRLASGRIEKLDKSSKINISIYEILS